MDKAKTKKGFCLKLDWGVAIDWYDRGHYVGFRVTIINPQMGPIDSKFFAFDDYLKQEERSDKRKDYAGGFEVIEHCGWDWYISVPGDTSYFTGCIEDYLFTFRGGR